MSPLSLGTRLLSAGACSSTATWTRRLVSRSLCTIVLSSNRNLGTRFCGAGKPDAPTHRSNRRLRLEHGEALVGVERPRLDELALVGLAPQRLHRAGEHEPVEHLLLAGLLDRRQRRSA